jgi:hypothetical protein
MVQELELIEENSSSCPVDTTTSTGGGVPLVLMMAVGIITVAGIAYMVSNEKPDAGVIK